MSGTFRESRLPSAGPALADALTRLSRVEQERDEAREASEQWCQRYADMGAELVSARTNLAAERALVEQLRADYAEAADELDRMTAWQARDAETISTLRGQLADVRAAATEQVRAAREAANTPTSKEKSMPATFDDGSVPDGIVCTVTPTIQDGTVVCWYRSEIAAEQRWVMVSASRNGMEVGEHLTNGEVPTPVLICAEEAHDILRADNDADLSSWATHRRERTFGGSLVRIERGGEGGNVAAEAVATDG